MGGKMKIKKLNRLGSLLLALTMLIQTLYPVLAFALEDTGTRIQGLEDLKEDKKEVSINLDPSILEVEGFLPLILKTRTQDPLAKDEEVKKASLIYKKDLVLDEKILEDLKTIGFQLEGPEIPDQDLGAEGKEEPLPIILNEEPEASASADLIQETENPDQVEDPNIDTETREDLETPEASQDYLEFEPGQDIVLPASQPIDYGDEFTYLRLELSKEAEDEIIKILKEGQANEKVLANLKEKIDLGIDLRVEEVRKLLILENMTYEQVVKETLQEGQKAEENKGIKVL